DRGARRGHAVGGSAARRGVAGGGGAPRDRSRRRPRVGGGDAAMNPVARPAGIAGETLVGLMVGMALSLLTVAAMLALYQGMVAVSRDTTRLAQRDGQVASAAMAAQMELQQAGFGIEPGTPGSSLWVAPDGQRVVWRDRKSTRLNS